MPKPMSNHTETPDQLTGKEISDLLAIKAQAQKVRRLQKEYFKSRSYGILSQSKAAEKELDQLLEDPQPQQTLKLDF